MICDEKENKIEFVDQEILQTAIPEENTDMKLVSQETYTEDQEAFYNGYNGSISQEIPYKPYSHNTLHVGTGTYSSTHAILELGLFMI